MNHLEFQARYNERVAQMNAQEKAECLGVAAQDGDAVALITRTPGVNLRYFCKPEAHGVIVSTKKESALDALLVYAVCIDVITGKTEKQRNELLGRLHFFNGKLTSRGINLSRWGCLFEVSPGQPAKDLISLSVIKTTPENTPKPETP